MRNLVYYLAGSPLEARPNGDGTHGICRANGEQLAHAFRMQGQRRWFFIETDKPMRGVPQSGELHGPWPRLTDLGKHVWSRYLRKKREDDGSRSDQGQDG